MQDNNTLPQFKDNKTIGDYSVGKTIGKGTFGKVKIGIHQITKQHVAIKILEKNKIVDQNDKIRVSRQISILRKIRHPNIIQLYQIIQTPSKLYLITEYADGGQLFQLIVKNQRLDQFQASKFLQQIINAVEYMHSIGITHRDLKPENLLLDSKKNIKVVDFGLSNQTQQNQQLNTACGSPCYAAPEMVSGKSYIGLQTDIWSCGIILYAMICGYLPFQDPDTNQLYKKIRSGIYEIPPFVSITTSDLLTKILNVIPEKRLNIQQIRNHPFCIKKQIPIKGLPIKGYPFLIQQNIVREVGILINVGRKQIEQNLKNNKHNKITATFNLILRGNLLNSGKSLLDYFREKQIQLIQKGNQQNNINIRKRKIISRSRQINSRKQNNNMKMSRQSSKKKKVQVKFQIRPSKIFQKIIANKQKQFKHLSSQKISRSRLASQVLFPKNKLSNQKIGQNLSSKINNELSKKIHVYQTQQHEGETQQSKMLKRIYDKNLQKLKTGNKIMRIRAKSKF